MTLLGKWIGDFTLEHDSSDPFRMSLQKIPNNENNEWDFRFRRGLFNREIQSWIGLMEKFDIDLLGNSTDNSIWMLDKSASFTTESR